MSTGHSFVDVVLDRAESSGAGHTLHAALFALPALAALALWWSLDLEVYRHGYPERTGRSPASPPDQPGRRDVLSGAVACSVAAAVIHASVIGPHFDEAIAAGLFFLAVTVAQASWPVWALARPSRAALAVGAMGNALVIGVWVASRTVGVPTGTGEVEVEVESVGVLDAVATGLEAMIVAAGVTLVRGRGLRRPVQLLTGTLRGPAAGSAAAAVTVAALIAA